MAPLPNGYELTPMQYAAATPFGPDPLPNNPPNQVPQRYLQVHLTYFYSLLDIGLNIKQEPLTIVDFKAIASAMDRRFVNDPTWQRRGYATLHTMATRNSLNTEYNALLARILPHYAALPEHQPRGRAQTRVLREHLQQQMPPNPYDNPDEPYSQSVTEFPGMSDCAPVDHPGYGHGLQMIMNNVERSTPLKVIVRHNQHATEGIAVITLPGSAPIVGNPMSAFIFTRRDTVEEWNPWTNYGQ